MSAILAVQRMLQSQFRYCFCHRRSYGTDFDNSEIASRVSSLGFQDTTKSLPNGSL